MSLNTPGTPGIQIDLSDKTDLEIFLLFLDNDLLDYLVTQTNLYANQYLDKKSDLPPHSRARLWRDTNREEMIKFIGLTLLMSLNSRPRIHQYWSTNPLFSSQIYGSTMSRDRYLKCEMFEFLHLYSFFLFLLLVPYL